MAISLQELKNKLFKQAAMGPAKPDAGSQAMMMAAQAARPAGAPPLPKPIDVEDGAGADADTDKMLKEKDSELEKAKKENEKLRHDLNKSELAHQQEMMMRDIEKKEKESLDKIKSEMEVLKNEKTLHQAEGVQHKAKLEKETAMAQVKIEQQKSKALIDYNKQQVQEQIKRTDEARKEADRYKDEARSEADRMKDEARSYMDQYRADVQKQLDTERSDMRKNLDTERATMQKSLDQERQSFEETKQAISPALDSLLDGTLKTLNSIPVPGSAPQVMKEAHHIVNDCNNKKIPQFSVLDVYSAENDTQFTKKANSHFNSIVQGYNVRVPHVNSSYCIVKAAAWPGWAKDWFGPDDYDTLVALHNTLKDGSEETKRALRFIRVNPIDGSPESVDQQQLKDFILSRIFSGHAREWEPIISEFAPDSLPLLQQATASGVNLQAGTHTKDRLADEGLGLLDFGREFVPHIVSRKANDKVEDALSTSNGINLYDETPGTASSPNLVTYLQRNSLPAVVNPETGERKYHSVVLSHDDQEKVVKLWDNLSLRNQQALGNILHPHFRQQVNWHPLSDDAYWKSNYQQQVNQTLASDPLRDRRAGVYNRQATGRVAGRGYTPNNAANIYTNRYDDATNGWYSAVGNFVPMANQVLQAAGSSFQLPTLPGTGYDGTRYSKPSKPIDPSGMQNQGMYGKGNDVRLDTHQQLSPGARTLRNMNKNNNYRYNI